MLDRERKDPSIEKFWTINLANVALASHDLPKWKITRVFREMSDLNGIYWLAIDGNQSERMTGARTARFEPSRAICIRKRFHRLLATRSDRGHLRVVSMNIAACKFSPLELAPPSPVFLLFLLGHPTRLFTRRSPHRVFNNSCQLFPRRKLV